MIQSLLYQVLMSQIPPSHAFFPEQYWCVWRWTWLGLMVLGRNGGGREPWTGTGTASSLGRSSPYLPLRSAQVKLRSLPSGSVTSLRTSLKTQPPLASDSPVGLPEICLQLIWFPTLVFPAASSLWVLRSFLPASISTTFSIPPWCTWEPLPADHALRIRKSLDS